MARGTLRFWAAAKAAAGVAEEPCEGATLGEVLAAARAGHGAELARVLERSSFLVDGVRAGPDTELGEGAVVEVLPPFAGG